MTRPDRDEVRAQLAAAFVEHVGDLWLGGRDVASPEWIAANAHDVLATMERLYAKAADDERPHVWRISRPHGVAAGAAAASRRAGAARRTDRLRTARSSGAEAGRGRVRPADGGAGRASTGVLHEYTLVID